MDGWMEGRKDRWNLLHLLATFSVACEITSSWLNVHRRKHMAGPAVRSGGVGSHMFPSIQMAVVKQ